MRRMRQFVVLTICVVIIVSLLCGCGNEDNSQLTENEHVQNVGEHETQAETSIAPEKLCEFITKYKEVYTTLTEEQRAEIITVWSTNTFRYESVEDILNLYANCLSGEAAIGVVLWNMNACVDYVFEKCDEPYKSQLKNVIEDSIEEILNNCNSEDRVAELLWNGYMRIAEIGNKEAQETGTTKISEGVFEYSEVKGKEDAEAFLKWINE